MFIVQHSKTIECWARSETSEAGPAADGRHRWLVRSWTTICSTWRSVARLSWAVCDLCATLSHRHRTECPAMTALSCVLWRRLLWRRFRSSCRCRSRPTTSPAALLAGCWTAVCAESAPIHACEHWIHQSARKDRSDLFKLHARFYVSWS